MFVEHKPHTHLPVPGDKAEVACEVKEKGKDIFKPMGDEHDIDFIYVVMPLNI